jgi:cytochrome c556
MELERFHAASLLPAPGTRPTPPFLSQNLPIAGGTAANIAIWTRSNRQKAAAHVFQRDTNQGRDTVSNAVVAMLGVPAPVTVEAVPHVQEFLTDHDLERTRLRPVDAL